MNRKPIAKWYQAIVRWLKPLCLSLMLLFFRVIWGWGSFQAGKGKLTNVHKPIEFFKELHIPLPVFNAWLVSIVECVGGLMLLFGLGARFAAAAIVIDMIVAYIAADREALSALWTDQEMGKFMQAAPFWFLVASFIILALGPGWFSIDALIKRIFVGARREAAGALDGSRLG